MELEPYIMPLNVSFFGINMMEIHPVDTMHRGGRSYAFFWYTIKGL